MNLIPNPPGKIVGGEVIFNGQDILKMDKKAIRQIRGNKISMIFQDPMTSLNPFLKISTQMIETIRLHQGLSKKDARDRAIEMLKLVGIPAAEKRVDCYPHQFSGGQLQRIGIALALAQDCRLLIADEPTTALDVTIQAQIVSLLLRLKEEKGLSIIFISHDIELVAEISDRIAVMYRGKIIETAPAQSIMTCPQHAYTKSLIASIPGRRDGDAG